MSIKTGLLVLGGVAVVGTIAYAMTRKKKGAAGRGVYIESYADRGVWDVSNSALSERFTSIHTYALGEAKPGVERFVGEGDVVVLRVGAGPWISPEGGDLRPVSSVAEEFAALVRLFIDQGAVVVALPSVLPWTTALGNLPGAGDRVTVLRRAAQMFDTWIRSQHTRPGFEGDGLFKAIVDVDAMKAADGMIDPQFVGVDGALNDAGQARLTALVDAAIREAA